MSQYVYDHARQAWLTVAISSGSIQSLPMSETEMTEAGRRKRSVGYIQPQEEHSEPTPSVSSLAGGWAKR